MIVNVCEGGREGCDRRFGGGAALALAGAFSSWQSLSWEVAAGAESSNPGDPTTSDSSSEQADKHCKQQRLTIFYISPISCHVMWHQLSHILSPNTYNQGIQHITLNTPHHTEEAGPTWYDISSTWGHILRPLNILFIKIFHDNCETWKRQCSWRSSCWWTWWSSQGQASSTSCAELYIEQRWKCRKALGDNLANNNKPTVEAKYKKRKVSLY